MKENLETLIQILENTPEVISNYVSLISEDELNAKRGENFWTIEEHLVHLDYVQDILLERILKFKNEDEPKITPYFPEDDKIEKQKFNSIDEILISYKNKRDKQIKLINEIKDSAVNKKAFHDEYKKYNFEIVLNHILFHDYWHMYRIEELWLTKDQYLSK